MTDNLQRLYMSDRSNIQHYQQIRHHIQTQKDVKKDRMSK